MESNIIRMDNIKIRKLLRGGGTPPLITPNSLKNLLSLEKKFSSMEPYSDTKVFRLTHLPIIDRENHKSTIPAPSKRFIDSLKVIFGTNSFVPLQTRYNHKLDRLEFLYVVSFEEIKTSALRLKHFLWLISSLKKLTNAQNISELFSKITGDQKNIVQEFIKNYVEENNLSLLSHTGLVKVLSMQDAIYERFEPIKNDVQTNPDQEKQLFFVSKKAKEISEKILETKRVQIIYQDDLEIVCNGSFSGNLPGLIHSLESNTKFQKYEDKTEKTLEEFVYEKFKLKDSEKYDVDIGIIDGGISENAIIKDELESYKDSMTYFGEKNVPEGNHAEMVTSLVLWAPKLSEKTNDKLNSPRTHLFNVISEKRDTTNTFKYKVRKIISEYFQKIKIWNISLNFLGEKIDETLSHLGVFFDKIQKEYGVLIFVPTGNLDKNDEDIINAPSGSYMAMSISSVKSNYEKTSYSKKGHSKYLNQKPDFSIFGGDKNDEIKLIANNFIHISEGGTSFASPLAARKAVALMAYGFNVIEIPAILNVYAAWFSKKNAIEANDYIGNGVMPIDSTELFNLINNRALVTIKQTLSPDYWQGFTDFSIPKYNDKYDAAIFSSINIVGKLAGYSTYEYVLDSSTYMFGRIDPFTNKITPDVYPLKKKDRDFWGLAESSLRIYKGKFKTRNIKISIPKRARSSEKFNQESGTKLKITKWGIKFVRNLIGMTRKDIGNQEIAMAFIFESKNPNFFNEFININKNYVVNYNEVINRNIVQNQQSSPSDEDDEINFK